MAFETSEAFYAGLSTFGQKELELAKTNQEAFNELYEKAIDAFNANALDGTGDATKTGMINTINKKTREGGLTSLYSDLASQISAVLATRSAIGQKGSPSAIYLTGNVWNTAVQQFKIEAFGMKDYNSSDVILQYGNTYYGISLKKKPYESSSSPPLINSSFGTFLEEQDSLRLLLRKVDDARLKFFAKIIWDACQDNTPNSPFWVQELNEGQGGTILECRSAQTVKATKNLKTERFTIQGIRLESDGTLSRTNAEKILNVKVNVWKPTSSKPSVGKFYAEDKWKMETGVPLINIKDTKHLATISTRFPGEFRMKFREYVNGKLSARGGQISELWQQFDEILNDPTPAERGSGGRSIKRILADSLLTRTLKLHLYSELKKFDGPNFEFFLVEGVGRASKVRGSDAFKASIGTSVVKPLKSIIATMADLCSSDCAVEIERVDASEAAAKVEYVLSITPAGSRNKVKVLHIDLRYGGDFKSYPRFHATMTQEFMQLSKGK